MTDDEASDLSEYRNDEHEIAKHFFVEAYDTLLKQARSNRRRAGFQATMMTDDILQEAFLKVCGKTAWQSREHFLRCVSLAMRQVVVDHARRRLSEKRGQGVRPVTLEIVERVLPNYAETPEQIVVMSDLLEKLEHENPRWLRIVDARYFAGMSEAETAAALGLSQRTIRRDWQLAREWLSARMHESN
jgi:RNA polymerase sigma factor (TIGR02999 family)